MHSSKPPCLTSRAQGATMRRGAPVRWPCQPVEYRFGGACGEMRSIALAAKALSLLMLSMGIGLAQEAVQVSVDPSVRYQTILGWGKTTPWLPASAMLRQECIDQAVNDLGINRLRFEGVSGNSIRHRSWEWLNDNNDPFDINWGGFNAGAVDERAIEWLGPWKRAVEARGEKFDLYVSPSFFHGGGSGDVPPWMLNDPQEYAEWVLALLLRLRDVHGITADYVSICNEAGNDNAFTPQVVARCMKALMPRLRREGFRTAVQFPETVNASAAWQYIQALRNDPEVWQWIGLISYHWYGTKPDQLPQLRDFAWERGLPTAQTEFMDLTIDHLYNDLVLGGTSYWEVYGLASPDYKAALSHVTSDTFHGGQWYWRFRQVSHYVRPGAVRVGCASSGQGLRCLAFMQQARPIVVLINTSAPRGAREVTVAGLTPGAYGLSRCVGTRTYEELGVAMVGGDGRLSVQVPADTVLTIYAREAANCPPVVTAWRSEPAFLALPASSVRLSCSATDPEADALSYEWRVLEQPAGAQVRLRGQGGQQAEASGMSSPGDYVFEVRVSDGDHAVSRQLMVRTFAGNQPPVPTDVHNRMPVWVRVKDGGTLLRAAAWDIEDDVVTFRWSVAKQPAGASARLEKPNEAACRVMGLTVPGDYVFRLEVSDGQHTVAVDHTVPVYP